MPAATALERRYRRLLALYPPAFRSDHGEEMLAVLIESSPTGATRPEFGDCANLILNALRLRLRPGVPRSARTMFVAIRLMYVGAILELCALAVVAVTASSVRSAVLARHSALTPAEWHAITVGQLLPVEIGSPLVAALLVWLAWANGRGLQAARLAFVALFAVDTAGLAVALARGSATYARADLIVASLVWLAALATVLLIFSRRARPHYARAPRLRTASAA